MGAIKEIHGDRRRTHIVSIKEGKPKAALLSTTEMVPEKTIWVAVTAEGLISSALEDNMPRLSGKEAPAWIVKTNTRDTLYLVCENGEAAAIPVHAIPDADNPLDGVSLSKVSPLKEGHQLATTFTLPTRTGRADDSINFEDWHVLTASFQGYVKKSPINELPGASANVFTLVRINEGDRLGWLQLTNGQNEVLLVTTNGMAIRFHEEEVRPMGLVAAGVMGIKLQGNDLVAGIGILPGQGEVFMITDAGRARRVEIEHFPRQGRYGQGVVAWKLAAREKIIGVIISKGTTRGTVFMKKLLPKAIRLDEAPIQSRTATRGTKMQEVKTGNQITRFTTPCESPRPTSRKKRSAKTKSTS